MAVNDDNSDSYDSDDDEALRAAKRAIYHRQRTDKSKKDATATDGFSSESEY